MVAFLAGMGAALAAGIGGAALLCVLVAVGIWVSNGREEDGQPEEEDCEEEDCEDEDLWDEPSSAED